MANYTTAHPSLDNQPNKPMTSIETIECLCIAALVTCIYCLFLCAQAKVRDIIHRRYHVKMTKEADDTRDKWYETPEQKTERERINKVRRLTPHE